MLPATAEDRQRCLVDSQVDEANRRTRRRTRKQGRRQTSRKRRNASVTTESVRGVPSFWLNSRASPSLECRLRCFATNAFNTALRLVLIGTMRVLKNFVPLMWSSDRGRSTSSTLRRRASPRRRPAPYKSTQRVCVDPGTRAGRRRHRRQNALTRGTDPKSPADVDRPITAPARRQPPGGRGKQRVGCPCFWELPRNPARLRQPISVLVTSLDHPRRHRCGPLEATVPWLISNAPAALYGASPRRKSPCILRGHSWSADRQQASEILPSVLGLGRRRASSQARNCCRR